MSSTKKHTVLDIQQRLCVLKDIRETSMTAAQLAEKYGVARRTILRIKQNVAKITTFAGAQTRRKLIRPRFNELDEQLLAWFKVKKTLGHRVTDNMLLERAKELKAKIPSSSGAQISRGWLTKFKDRHCIKLLTGYADSDNVDEDKAQSFVDDFQRMIDEEGVDLDRIYNMSDSKLVWKALPSKALKGEEEKIANAIKAKRDFLTVVLCANASGTHKLQPLVIHKFKNPRALKHETSLPVMVRSQTKAEMSREIFLDWLENHFKPSVKQYQEESKNYGKVVLLLDNCEGQKVLDQEDTAIKIVYLPPNTAFVIQPMNLGIMEGTKKGFRYKLMQRAVTYEGGVLEFYKNYTLKHCIDLIHYSWDEITRGNIRDAWNRVLYQAGSSTEPATEVPDWQDMMTDLTKERCTPAHVSEYLAECKDLEVKDKIEEEQEGAEGEPPEEPEEQAEADGEPPDEPEEQVGADGEPPEESEGQAGEKGNPLKEPEEQAVAEGAPMEVPEEQAVAKGEPMEVLEEQAIVKGKPLEELEEQAAAQHEPPEEPEEQTVAKAEPMEVLEEQAVAEGEPMEVLEEQAVAKGEPLEELEELEEQTGAKREPPEEPEEQVRVKGEPPEEPEEQAGAKREPPEEPEDMFFEGRTDEHIHSELSKAFETVSLYAERSPIYIQYIVRGLKAFFLGED